MLFRDDVVGPAAFGGVALVIAGAYLTSRREASPPGTVGRQAYSGRTTIHTALPP